MAVTSRTRVSAWSIRIGSRPCTPSVLRNHTELFQSGSSARRSRSTIRSGIRIVWRTYGPRNRLYTPTAPVHASGSSVYVTCSAEKKKKRIRKKSHHRNTHRASRETTRPPVHTEPTAPTAVVTRICLAVYRFSEPMLTTSEPIECRRIAMNPQVAMDRASGAASSSRPISGIFPGRVFL